MTDTRTLNEFHLSLPQEATIKKKRKRAFLTIIYEERTYLS